MFWATLGTSQRFVLTTATANEYSVDKNRKECIPVCAQEIDDMALEERDAQLTPEALSELTGRLPEDFEAPNGLPLLDPNELENHDADEFYSEG